MISPAIIRSATDGTKAVEPGMSLLTVHFRAPGGQIRFSLQLMAGFSSGQMEVS